MEMNKGQFTSTLHHHVSNALKSTPNNVDEDHPLALVEGVTIIVFVRDGAYHSVETFESVYKNCEHIQHMQADVRDVITKHFQLIKHEEEE